MGGTQNVPGGFTPGPPSIGDTQFQKQLFEWLDLNKNKKDSEIFWPKADWLVRLIKRYKHTFKAKSGTLYSKKKLLIAMAPALFFHYATRRLFDIPGGEGRIVNASMNYRRDPFSKTWACD